MRRFVAILILLLCSRGVFAAPEGPRRQRSTSQPKQTESALSRYRLPVCATALAAIASVGFTGLALFDIATNAPLPASHTVAEVEIPDLWQKDPSYDLPGGGANSCGPVSLESGGAWLYDHVHKDIIPISLRSTERDQKPLVEYLSKEMQRGQNAGVHSHAFLFSIKEYLRENKIEGYTTRVLGWPLEVLDHDEVIGLVPTKKREKVATVGPIPLDEIKKQTMEGSAVWLDLGRFDYDSDKSTYHDRVDGDGHYVRLVGWGVDATGSPSPDTLVIEDPWTPSDEGRLSYVPIKALQHGTVKSDPLMTSYFSPGIKTEIEAETQYIIDNKILRRAIVLQPPRN